METLARALVKIQAEMPTITKDGKAVYGSYVTLDHLLAEARPILTKHGVAVAQFPTIHEHGAPTLTTILIHESGERLEYVSPLYIDKQTAQGHGSAITYARRYALASALGISSDEDDDGAAASKPKPSRPKAEPKPKPEEPAPGEMGTRTTPMSVEEAAAYTATQGKYEGRTIKDVYREDPGFISAVANSEKPSKAREAAQVWLAEMERLAADPELPL